MNKVFYKAAVLLLIVLAFSSCGKEEETLKANSGSLNALKLDSSFLGEWQRTDLSNGKCETLSLITTGLNTPDSQHASYIVQESEITYVWSMHTANLVCGNASSYSDILTLKITGISESNGTTTIATSITGRKRTVHNNAGADLLNSAGGSCGVTAWAANTDFEYTNSGFVCSAAYDRRFKFRQTIATIGSTLYFTMKRNGATLDLQLSGDLNNLGAVESLDPK